MNTLKLIVVLSIALLGTHLIYHQVVNGQVSERPNPVPELIKNGIPIPDGCATDCTAVLVVPPNNAVVIDAMNKVDELNVILDYWYQHADNANPVQDLVDKGLVNSTQYTGKDCASIKQSSDAVSVAMENWKNAEIQKYLDENKQKFYSKWLFSLKGII